MNHSDDFYWHIYKMPNTSWGGSVAGIVFDGCVNRASALQRVVVELDKVVRLLWDDLEKTHTAPTDADVDAAVKRIRARLEARLGEAGE